MDEIFARASVREFQEKAIDPRKVKEIMKAAMAAPSAGNQQPWEFYIVTDRDLRGKLSRCSRYAGPAEKAPLCIVPCSVKRVRHADYVEQDMAACCQNILLAATSLGIGSVWLGMAPKENRMEMVRNALNIPQHLDPFAVIALGYPASEPEERENRFDIEKIHFRTLPEERFE